MPIHLVMEDARALALHAAGAGMLARLAIHYWLTDCHPLPRSDYALCQLARAHKPTWYQERGTIRAILNDVLPLLAFERKQRQTREDNLSRLRDKSASVRRLQTTTRKAHAATDPAPVVQPKRKQANRAPVVDRSTTWQD
jgi:hypothetical protein